MLFIVRRDSQLLGGNHDSPRKLEALGLLSELLGVRTQFKVLRPDAGGIIDIEGRDRNAWYLDLARGELAALEGELRPLVTARIGHERAEHFIANWQQLVLVLERGELRPAHFKARKPVTAA